MKVAKITEENIKKVTYDSLHDLLWNKKDYEIRVSTTDWVVQEHRPIESMYIDNALKQIIFIIEPEV